MSLLIKQILVGNKMDNILWAFYCGKQIVLTLKKKKKVSTIQTKWKGRRGRTDSEKNSFQALSSELNSIKIHSHWRPHSFSLYATALHFSFLMC